MILARLMRTPRPRIASMVRLRLFIACVAQVVFLRPVASVFKIVVWQGALGTVAIATGEEDVVVRFGQPHVKRLLAHKGIEDRIHRRQSVGFDLRELLHRWQATRE